MATKKMQSKDWQPPIRIEKDELIRLSDAILAEPDIAYTETEDVFRIHSNGLDWDTVQKTTLDLRWKIVL